MGFLSKFKKKEVPEELPDLAIEELKKELKEANTGKKEKTPEQEKSNSKQETKESSENQEQKKDTINETQEKPQKESEEKTEEVKPKEEKEEESKEGEKEQENKEGEKESEEKGGEDEGEEKSFFNEILNELEKGNENQIQQIEKMMNSSELVNEMKKYWDKENERLIQKKINEKYKQEIASKIQELKEIEIGWRKIYLDLTAKEEEMLKKERELKKIIKEFHNIHKVNEKETKKIYKKKKAKI